MYKSKKIAVVIPAHNEEKLIKPTLENIPEFIDTIVVVDDASIDATAEVISGYLKEGGKIVLINHKNNTGVGRSIIDGYMKSIELGCHIAVVIGGDFQMDLNEVNKFLDPIIESRADYTKGNRFLSYEKDLKKMPKIKRLGNFLISFLAKVSSGYYHIYDAVDGYTAISAEAIKKIDWSKAWQGYGYPMDFLMRLNLYGFRVMDIPRRAIYIEGERQSQIKGFRYFINVTPMLLKNFLYRVTRKYLKFKI